MSTDSAQSQVETGDTPEIVDAQIQTDIAILDAIKSLRAQAAAERVAMHERGEPLTGYSAGVLDGLDRAWLTGFRAARKPIDTRETTSPEEWWACERAFLAGREDALVNPPAGGEGRG